MFDPEGERGLVQVAVCEEERERAGAVVIAWERVEGSECSGSCRRRGGRRAARRMRIVRPGTELPDASGVFLREGVGWQGGLRATGCVDATRFLRGVAVCVGRRVRVRDGGKPTAFVLPVFDEEVARCCCLSI